MATPSKKKRLNVLEERNRIALFHLREMQVSEPDPDVAEGLLAIISILEGGTDDLLGLRGGVPLRPINTQTPDANPEPFGAGNLDAVDHTGKAVLVFPHSTRRPAVSGKRRHLKLVSNNT